MSKLYKTKKIGIVVDHLGVRQQANLVVEALNNLVNDDSYNISPFLFFKEYAYITQPTLFPVLPVVNLWEFDSPTIAIDLPSAQLSLNYPLLTDRYFYVWDLEWLFLNNKNYRELAEIYTKTKLISRTKYHADILTQCWQKPTHIFEDFNYHEISKLAK